MDFRGWVVGTYEEIKEEARFYPLQSPSYRLCCFRLVQECVLWGCVVASLCYNLVAISCLLETGFSSASVRCREISLHLP